MMNIHVRDATLNDLPVIVDIYNSTIPSRLVTADIEPVTVESRQGWFHEHSPDRRPLWVIECDGLITGWVSFQSFYGRPAYEATAEVSIYFHQNFRGKGMGKFMLGKVMDSCPELKIKNLLAFIFGHNEPSLRLFYRHGFEKWGHLPNVAELDGIERDLLILGKKV
jgi:phosphinothricin acetyltransferase